LAPKTPEVNTKKERERDKLRQLVHACMTNTEYPYHITDSVVWFPRKLSDLDTFAEKVMEMGEELSKFFKMRKKKFPRVIFFFWLTPPSLFV
jgi:hypothetical protein